MINQERIFVFTRVCFFMQFEPGGKRVCNLIVGWIQVILRLIFDTSHKTPSPNTPYYSGSVLSFLFDLNTLLHVWEISNLTSKQQLIFKNIYIPHSLKWHFRFLKKNIHNDFLKILITPLFLLTKEKKKKEETPQYRFIIVRC